MVVVASKIIVFFTCNPSWGFKGNTVLLFWGPISNLKTTPSAPRLLLSLADFENHKKRFVKEREAGVGLSAWGARPFQGSGGGKFVQTTRPQTTRLLAPLKRNRQEVLYTIVV